MFSLRYGTVPIVRKTGGLADTIKHFDCDTEEGNGFVFETYDAGGILWALSEAVSYTHLGDSVKASADGVVSEIVRDDLLGNYVVIDHENGWKTTYSQLAELNCSVGEAVSAGEIIGSVSAPSIYSEAMGPHVEFMVTLDDVSVNPEVAVG